MISVDWETLDKATSCLANVSILVAAAAAAVKFRVFRLHSHRWRSELTCCHHELGDKAVLFLADYTVHNTGGRPIHLSRVTLRLFGATTDGVHLTPDTSRLLAERVIESSDPARKGLCTIMAGERSIFTLRCKLGDLDDAIFVLCSFDWTHGRIPASYAGLYVKPRSRPPGDGAGECQPVVGGPK